MVLHSGTVRHPGTPGVAVLLVRAWARREAHQPKAVRGLAVAGIIRQRSCGGASAASTSSVTQVQAAGSGEGYGDVRRRFPAQTPVSSSPWQPSCPCWRLQCSKPVSSVAPTPTHFQPN